MSTGIVLHKDFVYPAAAVVSTFYLVFWQTTKVSSARKAAKIEYPQVYAEKAEAAANKAANAFNCAQRAHQNTLESLPVVISGTLIAGFTYPVPSAALCAVWVASRVLYTIGYATGDPRKRNTLGTAYVGIFSLLGIMGTSTASIVSLFRSL